MSYTRDQVFEVPKRPWYMDAMKIVLAIILFAFVVLLASRKADRPQVPTAEELRLQAVATAELDARAERASTELGVTVTLEDLAPPPGAAEPPPPPRPPPP